MKKIILVLSVFALLITTVAFAADYQKLIIGSWTYEFKGQQAAVEHNTDGTFSLVMGTTTVKGTYTVKGNSLTLITEGKKTPYTIQSYDGKKMTMKRDKDSRIIVYVKK